MRRFIYLLLTLFTFLLLAGGGALFWLKHHLAKEVEVPSLIYIPKGSTKTALAYISAHYVPLHEIDAYLIKYYGYPQAGWIEAGGGKISLATFFQKLTHAKAALRQITLIPGETTPLILDQLADTLDLNRTRLLDAYHTCTDLEEGLLFPDSYQIPVGIDEKGLIDYLCRISLQKHENLSRRYLGRYDKEEWFGKIVTTASVIQKEAASSEEMPLVSAVIRNRLKKGMKLQMDGTLNYGRYSHTRVTPRRIREDVTTFNTYRYAGLPERPVCTVGEDAIRAALKPADVDFLYFVRGSDGRHHFTKSYKSHLRQIRKVKNGKK